MHKRGCHRTKTVNIPWAITAIVGALREVAAELAIDCWVPVAKATEWISTRYPEKLPKNCGCRSWPQVLQKSRCFELRYRQTGGQRVAWYRVRSHKLSAGRPSRAGRLAGDQDRVDGLRQTHVFFVKGQGACGLQARSKPASWRRFNWASALPKRSTLPHLIAKRPRRVS